MGQMVGKFRQVRLDYASKLGRTVSVKEVAEKIGVSRQFFSDVEHNKERPSWDTIEKLCALYGVQPGDLLSYEDWLTLAAALAEHCTATRAEVEALGMVAAAPMLQP